MTAAIWKIRATEGAGWLREMADGEPLITADHLEAQQFPTRKAAQDVLTRIPADRVRMLLVPAAAHEPVIHGAP